MPAKIPSDENPSEFSPPDGPKRFVSREECIAAFADAPRIDYERFRADLDAVVDPCEGDAYEHAYGTCGCLS